MIGFDPSTSPHVDDVAAGAVATGGRNRGGRGLRGLRGRTIRQDRWPGGRGGGPAPRPGRGGAPCRPVPALLSAGPGGGTAARGHGRGPLDPDRGPGGG